MFLNLDFAVTIHSSSPVCGVKKLHFPSVVVSPQEVHVSHIEGCHDNWSEWIVVRILRISHLK